MGRNDRPEHSAPPEIFYNETEAKKYTENSRMIAIQTKLTERAVELLALPNDGTPKLLLDLGCGSGLSGEALTEQGHIWVVIWGWVEWGGEVLLRLPPGPAGALADLAAPAPPPVQGTDISPAMLNIACEREVEGDICLHDLGHGLPLRPGTFDGAISISAVQWLCNAVRRGRRAGQQRVPAPSSLWRALSVGCV